MGGADKEIENNKNSKYVNVFFYPVGIVVQEPYISLCAHEIKGNTGYVAKSQRLNKVKTHICIQTPK